MGQIPFRSQSGHHTTQKLKSQKNIFFKGQCTMVLCTAHYIFIEWGVAVFELRGAPFWSQTFRFAQTDGTRIETSSIGNVPELHDLLCAWALQ